ncbi:MAG: OsmC family peroxiredoxin [Bacteroidetes bacterium]|nr:OsmC family peroxiredoxin [Bacteroidota bacterium]
MTQEPIDVRTRQEPLRQQYRETPEAARITDRAVTIGSDLSDPWHGTVKPGSEDHGETWPFGVHRAVGGFHDEPNPGDILCAALATCLDSTIRLIADRLSVTLEALEVEVTADVDVRGTLVVRREMPVRFQTMRCHVDIEPAEGTDPKLVRKLLKGAEYSCVNLQTLRNGVSVETSVDIEGTDIPDPA